MGKFLGLDSSTQSLTGLVIDTQTGQFDAELSIHFDTHFKAAYGIDKGVLHLGGGQVHSAPLMWAEALDLLFQTLRDQGCDLGQIQAVAGSGQQHGTVYLNEEAEGALTRLRGEKSLRNQLAGIFSRPTAPIWMDTSTTAQCQELEEGVGGRRALLELTGNTAFERFSGPQIRKFAQEDPAGYRRTAHIGLVSSYMASLLAGRLVPVDPGDGSGTNLMDIRSRQWSPVALAACAAELEHKLLPITPADRPAGSLSPYFVSRYGFAPGCQVFPFSGDNPSSLIGLGLVEPGQVALSLGTSDTLFACMDQPRVSEQGEGAVFASPDGTHYMALICFLNGSLAREAVRDRHHLDWQGFTGALHQTPPGNGGALMLPYFAPEIVPKVATPGQVSRRLDWGNAAACVRAVIEAQALSSKIHSEWMGVAIRSLCVTGGASANEEILRVFADVHGCPVHRFETANSAALGAALRAYHGHLKASGAPKPWKETTAPFAKPLPGSTIQPNPAAAEVYKTLIEEYRKLEQAHAG